MVMGTGENLTGTCQIAEAHLRKAFLKEKQDFKRKAVTILSSDPCIQANKINKTSPCFPL